MKSISTCFRAMALMLLVAGLSKEALAATTVTSVSPNRGPINGGQLIRIRGTGFVAGETVTLAGVTVPAANVTFVSASVLDVVTPSTVTLPPPTGVVDVAGVNAAAVTYTYVQRNGSLQVTIQATVRANTLIVWGNNTSVDDGGTPHGNPLANTDPGRISPFLWTVQDSTGAGGIITDALYRSDDQQNNKTLEVLNLTTGGGVDLTFVATIPPGNPLALLGGAAGAATALNSVRISASATAPFAAFTNINTPQTLVGTLATAADGLANAATQAFVLQFDSPSNLSGAAAFNTQYTFTVMVNATAD